MPESKYLLELHANERWEIIKGLVPPGVLRLRSYLLNRSRFPGAYVSGDSCVDQGALIGRGCVVRSSHVGASADLGAFSTLGENCVLAGEGKISIGRYCSIAPEVSICSRSHRHLSRTTYPLKLWLDGVLCPEEHTALPVHIGNDVWIGRRAIILAGAVIPDGCVVGAGSVVGKREYPPYSVIAGAPASVRTMRFEACHVQELMGLRWWERDPKDIFRDLLNFLHQVPGKGDGTAEVNRTVALETATWTLEKMP